jgi:hypothetical protein
MMRSISARVNSIFISVLQLIDEAFSVAQEKLFAQKFFTNYDGRPTNQLEYPMKDTPAFPHTIEHLHEPVTTGMTLRDYFAAKAMQGLIASPRGTPDGSNATDIYYARVSYLMADAMMEAREQ